MENERLTTKQINQTIAIAVYCFKNIIFKDDSRRINLHLL